VGLERHDRVADLCPNVPELLELHHAVPAAGGVLVAIDVRLSAGEVGYILVHSGFRVLFVDPEPKSLAAEAPAGLEVVRLCDEYERLVASGDPTGVPSGPRDEEEPIAIATPRPCCRW
jgi:fatty-acyl-CoA synthase